MSYRPYQQSTRRRSRQIMVGTVPVGGDAPITVQTMTNTLTTDVAATVAQIRRSEEAGVDIVRVSCPDQEGAFALKDIVRQVSVPIVADIHFHYRRAIEAAQSGAACLRINPGNIGSADRVREVERRALERLSLNREIGALREAAAEVGAVMIVGGNIEGATRTMTTAIALETSKGDLPLALALGLLLMAIVLGVNALAQGLRDLAQRRAA